MAKWFNPMIQTDDTKKYRCVFLLPLRWRTWKKIRLPKKQQHSSFDILMIKSRRIGVVVSFFVLQKTTIPSCQNEFRFFLSLLQLRKSIFVSSNKLLGLDYSVSKWNKQMNKWEREREREERCRRWNSSNSTVSSFCTFQRIQVYNLCVSSDIVLICGKTVPWKYIPCECLMWRSIKLKTKSAILCIYATRVCISLSCHALFNRTTFVVTFIRITWTFSLNNSA